MDGVRALSVRITPARYDDPEVTVLVADVQEEYRRRYGGPDETPTVAAEFAAPRGAFRVGRVADAAVAMGGWRSRDALDDRRLADGDAELKRMYVTPRFQRRGVARALLAELEASARAAGRRRMVLETGSAQPEAISLYTSAGYVAIPGFGLYGDEEEGRHMAKLL